VEFEANYEQEKVYDVKVEHLLISDDRACDQHVDDLP
jgi:hypothetical protein